MPLQHPQMESLLITRYININPFQRFQWGFTRWQELWSRKIRKKIAPQAQLGSAESVSYKGFQVKILKSGHLRVHFQHFGAKIRVLEQTTDITKFWLFGVFYFFFQRTVGGEFIWNSRWILPATGSYWEPCLLLTNINFLSTLPIHHQGNRLWELMKWSPKGKCLMREASNSLKKFFNPLSPINHIQILLTDLHIFP